MEQVDFHFSDLWHQIGKDFLRFRGKITFGYRFTKQGEIDTEARVCVYCSLTGNGEQKKNPLALITYDRAVQLQQKDQCSAADFTEEEKQAAKYL